MLTNREVNKSLAPVYAEMIARDLVKAFADRLPIKGTWDIELYRIVYHSNTEAMSLCITPAQFTQAVTDAALKSQCRIYVGRDSFQDIAATYLSFAIHCIQLKVDSWYAAGLPINYGKLIEHLNISWATIDVDPALSPFKEHSQPAPRSPEVRVCPVQAAQARREQRAREATAAAATSDAAYSDLLREADAHLRNKRFKAKKQAARKAAAARKQAAKPPPYGGPSRGHAASDDDEPAPPPPY
jgi:hypothetical protein